MKMRTDKKFQSHGQTAIEYLLLLALVAVVVLSSMKNLLPRTQQATELFYNRGATSIFGNTAPQDLRNFYLR